MVTSVMYFHQMGVVLLRLQTSHHILSKLRLYTYAPLLNSIQTLDFEFGKCFARRNVAQAT